MSEKLVIIAEKPSAYKAFVKALGGPTGEFNGNEYAIVHLYGHIIGNDVPDKTALPQYKDKVGGFSELGGIPWSASWFDFNKKDVIATGDFKKRLVAALNNVKGYLDKGYIPVIASDNDESGEGDLLVREVLIKLGYNGKTYREYHLDESPKSLQKSLRDLKVVTTDDPTYRAAVARSSMDYLTQQLTRVATIKLQNRGYKLDGPVPMGRLKSVILTIIGDQTKAIKAFKPSSVFESRYKLGSLVLTKKDMPQFKTKDEWSAEGLPEESHVKEVRQVPGETTPPKAMTLSQLSGALSKLGMGSKQFLDTYQKMYEAGVMSYPRTDDDFISPEQFNETLPVLDKMLGLLELPTAPFSHRTPRKTHVKTGGSHGALRPGMTFPNSVDELDATFGKHASDIYKIAGKRFVMMFLENTEWVRHEYETTDTPEPFKGSVKIITKQGVEDPDEEKSDTPAVLPDLTQLAKVYPHEVKATKPHKVDSDWLMKQLGKYGVGTGATRVSTFANMSSDKKAPIKEGKEVTLTGLGWVGYEAARGTKIGSVEGTKEMSELIEEVRNGADYDSVYQKFTGIIQDDVNTITNNAPGIDLDAYKISKQEVKEVAEGTWNGKAVRFNGEFMGHKYTEDEVNSLLAGQEIAFEATGKDGKPVKIKGKLAEQTYKGRKFVGLKAEFVREDDGTRAKGTWNGKEVSFKNEFSGHKFTNEEIQKLLAGEEISFDAKSKKGSIYTAKGKLEEQTFKGKKFVGFKVNFD